MERQKAMHQAGLQRTLARSGTVSAARCMDSSKTLALQGSRRRLAPNASVTGFAAEDTMNSNNLNESELYGSPTNNNSTSSSFDKLELLGPSLLEVLTLVNPPKPRAQQVQGQQDSQFHQLAGEDTTQESGETNQQFHSSSNASLDSNSNSNFLNAAKFDTCLSRSAILGKISDASVDNSRKTQEYFAKILDKLKIEATGLVLLQESTILLFLETSADQFLVLCKQLLQQKIIESTSMRILASCDGNPERILQGLYFKKVVVNRVGGDGNNNNGEWTDDSFKQHAVETFLNLVKFVKKIGPMAPAEIRKCLTNLSNTDQLFLPSNDLVLWLLAHEELMSLDEFLQVYDSSIAIELESERVWPVHPLIHY